MPSGTILIIIYLPNLSSRPSKWPERWLVVATCAPLLRLLKDQEFQEAKVVKPI